jgi:transposase InsO family protein
MWRLVRSACWFVRDLIRSRANLAAENQFLRQQLAVLRRQVGRARPTDSERRLLAFFARLFPWRDRRALHLVTPGTLIRWHRLGWRLYWTWKSRRKKRHRGGRPGIPEEVRELIRDMVRRNSQGRPWGIKRILGELEKLRISVSRRSVQKILREVGPRTPGGQRWSTFLRNHLACTWACDFFTVPTLFFRELHVFFVMKLDTREVISWNVTDHPSDAWTAQQLRNALYDRDPPRFLLRDRDTKYGVKFNNVLEGKTRTLLTPYRCPQANTYAERFVGSVRQECLDHMIPRNEEHLRETLAEVLGSYYHSVRPHQGLDQQIPAEVHNPVERPKVGPIKTREVMNGLYHVYHRDAAA